MAKSPARRVPLMMWVRTLHTWIGAACDKGLFGWPCDPEVEKLRNAFGMAKSEDERKQIAKDLQTRAMDDVVFLPFGQFDAPLAYRADPSTARPPARRCSAICAGGPRIHPS